MVMTLTGRSAGRTARTKKQVVAEFRHSEILDAARRVFAARGFERACVEDIAHLAGVAKGTVYLYYSSKEAIYRAALKEGLAELCRQLRARVEEVGTAREKLHAFAETKLAYVEAHHDFFRIYSSALGHGPRPLQCQKDFKGFYEEQIDVLRSALRPARNAETAAFAVFDVLRGVIERRLHGPARVASDREVRELLDLLWKGLSRP